MSSPPCWSTKTKDLALASFVGPPEVVLFFIVISMQPLAKEALHAGSTVKTTIALQLCGRREHMIKKNAISLLYHLTTATDLIAG